MICAGCEGGERDGMWSLRPLCFTGDDNVKHMWEQVKRVKVSSREVCTSVRVGGKNPNSMWWNDKIKAAVRRKENAEKGVLAASNEEIKERCMEVYREEKG